MSCTRGSSTRAPSSCARTCPRFPTTVPEPQRGEPTYADKLTVDEFRLDPSAHRVRARTVSCARATRGPGAWFRVDGRRVKVWRARAGAPGDTDPIGVGIVGRSGLLGTAQGALALDEVQPEGKRAMGGDAWLAGLRSEARVDPA